MNLKKIYDSVNKKGSEMTFGVAFRNFPDNKELDLASALGEILDGWTLKDNQRVEFGKSDISFAKGLGWGLEDTISFYTFTSGKSLDVSFENLQDWLDDITERIGDYCYVEKLTPTPCVYSYLTFEDSKDNMEYYDYYYEV